MFDHVQIKVNNLKTSRLFYDSIMKVLEHTIVLEIENTVIGYGKHTHNMFEIRQSNEIFHISQNVHIAFSVQNKAMVDTFYTTALKNGGFCNGKPGYRNEYEKGYYAAFIIDPDGHNIEAIYKEM